MSQFFGSYDGKDMTLYDFDECLENYENNLRYLFDSQKQTIESLRKRIEELEDEKFQDKEIQKLQNENEKLRKEMRNGFPISEEIDKKINKWQENHIKEKHWAGDRPKSFGAIGGNFVYEFIPTSIGTIITCKCCCGEKITINDM